MKKEKKGIDFTKDNLYDGIGRPDLKPKGDNTMEKETITFKSWWKKLFCNHDWLVQGDLVLYNSDNSNGLPIHKYNRWICKNCGKQKKIKIF